MNKDMAAVVLAGGASERMGREKALLTLPNGRTSLQTILHTARMVASPVLLAVDTPAHAERLCHYLPPPLPPLVFDTSPGGGPLAALAGAMRAVQTPAILALAVDTPLMEPAVLRLLLAALATMPCGTVEIVLPVIDGMPQPLPALYATALAERIEHLLRTGRSALRAIIEEPTTPVYLVDEPRLRSVDPHLRSFTTSNTPAEWEALLHLAKEPSHDC